MASLNPLTRELVFKIVFYGPGLGGKTTTLQYIHAATKPEHRGKMVSLATPMDRTLYFDFLPLRVPRVRGMGIRLQLFTVPGQVYYGATRKLVLTGADGVVFVADSQPGRMEANQESLEDLVANLVEHNRPLSQVSHTFHWNKRDLSDAVPVEELDRKFNVHGAPAIGTVATRGDGVFEGLEAITRLVVSAYEADLPTGERPLEKRYDAADDGGIADAIRGLAESDDWGDAPTPLPRPTPVPPTELASEPQLTHRVNPPVMPAEPPSDASKPDGVAPVAGAVPANAASERPVSRPEGPRASSERVVTDPGSSDLLDRAPSSMPSLEDVEELPTVNLAGDPLPTFVGRRGLPAGFTMTELWGDADREVAREAEGALASRDVARAVLLCDMLVTRVLASAAGLLGTIDAPRDPGSVALLLGLDGRRYLGFRSVVRAVRQSEEVDAKDAAECYAFALEARRARELIGR